MGVSAFGALVDDLCTRFVAECVWCVGCWMIRGCVAKLYARDMRSHRQKS
jgi:hypothetical protein